MKIIRWILYGIVIVLIILVVAYYIIELGLRYPSLPPERPTNVPQNAHWFGGADGGYWLEFVGRTNEKYRFKIYHGSSGVLELDADFVISDSCSNISFDNKNFAEKIYNVLEDEITLKSKRNGKFCYLKPLYPAYGGRIWEILKQKQNYD